MHIIEVSISEPHINQLNEKNSEPMFVLYTYVQFATNLYCAHNDLLQQRITCRVQ